MCIRLVLQEMLTSNEQERKEWSKLRTANRDKRPDLRNPAQEVAVLGTAQYVGCENQR